MGVGAGQVAKRLGAGHGLANLQAGRPERSPPPVLAGGPLVRRDPDVSWAAEAASASQNGIVFATGSWKQNWGPPNGNAR